MKQLEKNNNYNNKKKKKTALANGKCVRTEIGQLGLAGEEEAFPFSPYHYVHLSPTVSRIRTLSTKSNYILVQGIITI